MSIQIFKDKADISNTGASLFMQIAHQAIQERGKFTVALTGGTSPETMYQLIASSPYKEEIDWQKVFVFFGDERWVPLTDDKSNGKMADRTLLDSLPVSKDHIFYMWQADMSAEDFAVTYEKSIREVLGDDLSFDLILLGMGPDGHTASLFPHEAVLHEQHKLVDAYYLSSQSMYRITLTAPLINKAKNIVVMLFGEAKADALHQVLEGDQNTELYPAQLLKPLYGQLIWLVDEAAAQKLVQRK